MTPTNMLTAAKIRYRVLALQQVEMGARSRAGTIVAGDTAEVAVAKLVEVPMDAPSSGAAVAGTRAGGGCTLGMVGEVVETEPVGIDGLRAEFDRLDGIVRRALRSFRDAGQALSDIRDRELWRAGGYPNWDGYWKSIASMTRRHANRLIQAHEVVRVLEEVGPRGPTWSESLPKAEFQVRPLLRLKDDNQRVVAWTRALEVAGGQPSAAVVAQAVSEIMGGQPTPKSAGNKAGKTRTQQRREIFDELKAAIAGITHERLTELVARLDPLI